MTRHVDTLFTPTRLSTPGRRWAGTALALSVPIVLAGAAGACSKVSAPPAGRTGPAISSRDPMLQKLQTMTARFAPVDLVADVSSLPESERQVLGKLVEAARIFDALYLRQVWEGNDALLIELGQDQSDLGRARLA